MNVDSDPIAVVGGARTAIGRFGGSLKDVDAAELGAACIRAVLDRTGIEADEVDEVVMGQVGQVGPDAYNARRCALGAGLPSSSTAFNVNRLCSSGLQAILSGAQQLLCEQADVIAAGGNESMSRLPFLDYSARGGSWRLRSRELLDGTLALLTDPFGGYVMGVTAERVAERWNVSREEQDRFALRSQQRASAAIEQGEFADEIVPIGDFRRDEHPRPTTLEQLADLKPVFQRDGTVTAGNSSGINDGAGAVLLMRSSEARRRGLEPKLILRGWAVTGIDPDVMGYAPAQAVPRVLERIGWTTADVDIVELNEAFASQAVAVARDVRLSDEQLNPFGGAIALGHPVGATGAILTVKLMHALERTGGRRGLVTMCIGGGQGMAAAFERPPSGAAAGSA